MARPLARDGSISDRRTVQLSTQGFNKVTKSTRLKTRLRTLLTERRALRSLLLRYQMFLNLRHFNNERIALESEIATIISAGLPFNEHERIYKLPQAQHLATAAFNIRAVFNLPHLQDAPNLVWNGSPVPGILTDNWHPAVKERLLDLCGPLDGTLARMLSA